jgi:UDP-N-acetylglucosamine 2-epimerase (non-hydrolysing)/UDP-GlcNAc3NAcA epimerase
MAPAKVLTIFGSRPQFVKAAAVSSHLRERAEEVLVDTGQHYDPELSQIFIDELGAPPPDHQLEARSGTHAGQTSEMMVRLEPVVEAERPDAVLIYGDTNTTLAGALVAAKLDVPVAHVEAGMRSFDRTMPEEVNRIVADHVADLLLCSTEVAVENLRREGLGERARLVGDVMADIAMRFAPTAERRSRVLGELGLAPGGYCLFTAHRAANVDDPAGLERLVDVLGQVAARCGPVVFPVHPRTGALLANGGLRAGVEGNPGIELCEPLGYLEFAALLGGARALFTDSGGLQKEAYLAGVPCITMREQTEWVETVESGWNRLVGLDAERAVAAFEELEGLRGGERAPLYGDGQAGRRVVDELLSWLDRPGNDARAGRPSRPAG